MPPRQKPVHHGLRDELGSGEEDRHQADAGGAAMADRQRRISAAMTMQGRLHAAAGTITPPSPPFSTSYPHHPSPPDHPELLPSSSPGTTSPPAGHKKRKTKHKGSDLKREGEANAPDRTRSSSRNKSSSSGRTRPTLDSAAAEAAPPSVACVPQHISKDEAAERASTPDSFTSSQLAGYANLSLDSQSSEKSGDSPTKTGAKKSGNKVIAGRVLGGLNKNERAIRASSPAKRTRSEMESGTAKQDEEAGQQSVKNSESTLRKQMTPTDGAENAGNAEQSLPTPPKIDVPSLVEQVQEIINLTNEPMQEGDVGYVVSTKWLHTAQAMAEKGETDGDELGPIDNTGLNLVADPTAAPLQDEKGDVFIPLKPGLQIREDYEILPSSAWEKIVSWHGQAKGSPTITRYCHNTSQNEFQENLQYEIYPPIFTIYKLPGTTPNATNTSNPPPVRLLASRHEHFYKFLRKAKQTAGIARDRSVRVWKFMGGVAQASTAQPGVLTPADSRDVSPHPSVTIPIDLGKTLSISVDAFVSFQEGSQRELIEMKDETRLPKAEDTSNLGEVGLGQEGILVLEEQVPAGGEWVSTVVTSRSKGSVPIKGAKGADGTLHPGSTGSGRSSPTPSILTRGRSGKGRAKGTVGLGNLGNTCYMNSALQCVRACQELTEYFVGDFYKRELNPSNPLGNHGEVAKAYANLLKEIYKNENTSSFSPRNFRQTIGKYNPQFSGYQQQDSQEFVLFLLDGLQEDLNRITKKPYIEKPDSTDEMVHDHDALVKFAEENWRIYKARNDSVITDLFAGMYKSTLRCPVCDKVSIIFDPYNNLTLQLPVEDAWAKQILFFPLHSRPVNVSIELPRYGTFADIRKFISRKVEVDPELLVFAEIYNRTFYQLFQDSDPIAEIRDGDIIAAYQVDSKPTNLAIQEKKKKFTYQPSRVNDSDSDSGDDLQHSENMLVPIVHRHQNRPNTKLIFGSPSFITLTREESRSYETIMRKVWDRISTLSTYPFLDQFCDPAESEDTDMVVMSADDAESGSSEEKVQSKSVEGEDGMVDISMRDNDEDPNVQTVPRIAYPPMAPIHQDVHPALAGKQRLPDELDRQFSICVYRDGNEKRVPTGLSIPNDSKHWQTLKARRNKQKSEMIKQQKKRAKTQPIKKIDLKKAIQNGGTPSESEDELQGLPPAALDHPQSRSASPKANLNDSTEESDEDGVPPVRQVTAAASRNHGELHSRTLVPYNTDSEPDDIEAPSVPDRRYISDEVSPEPLLGLGCGLAIDWTNEAHLDFFGGGKHDEIADMDRGMPTWDSVATLPDPELDQKRMRRAQRKKQGLTLDECLDEFGKTEILSENDAWYCPRCKEHRRAEKTFELWKLPDVLVIHLKRFSVQGRLRDKLDVLVNFPIEGLDMTERMKGKEADGRELVYDLFAVDNHYGGLGGGHYTAYAKNFVDDNWYYFDDSMTSRRSAEASITGAAYLLFYRRRNGPTPLGGPNLEKVYAALDASSPANSESGSRSDSPNAFSGEGRRLGGSSRNGSSSASREAGAVRQAGGGGLRYLGAEEEEELEEVDLDHGSKALITVNGINSDLDEGYGGGDDELPSYDQSEGPSYGPYSSAPWVTTNLNWPNEEAASEKTLADDDDADVSSTGAVNDDDERSLPSPVLAGTGTITPEQMDEDGIPALIGFGAPHRRSAPSPEPAELRVEGMEPEPTKRDDDITMD